MEIPLTRNSKATVDDADFDWLSQFKWYALPSRTTVYAARNSSKEGDKKHTIYMHREVWERHHGLIPDGMEIDHTSGNQLDNREKNLRLCTSSQNHRNRRNLTNHSSEYKGVFWDKVNGRWRATIQGGESTLSIGRFDSEIEAARAYDTKARELFGEFAATNFP